MTRIVRLQCAHRNRLFRQCLVSVLESRQFEVQEIDHEGWDYCRLIERWQPAAVLVDLGLPERRAVELCRYVRKFVPHVKVVLLVPFPEPNLYDKQKLLECVEAGVQGYVLDECPLDELTMAITQATDINGSTYCSPQIMRMMFADLALLARDSQWLKGAVSSKLTRRELEVLKWVAEGMSNKQVAVRMSVSLNTIKNHIHNILQKLEVDDRFSAVQRAVDNQWLTRAGGYSVAKP